MNLQMSEEILSAVKQYRLPRYNELPNVGLYLKQAARYINEYLAPFPDMTITESMISNYVKKQLVSNPKKKQYDREQLAYLLFIAVSKSVLSLDHIKELLELQKNTYPCEVAYNYFCSEFENMLQYVFGIKAEMESVGKDSGDAKLLFRNIIVTVAHKIYLEQCFYALEDKGSPA